MSNLTTLESARKQKATLDNKIGIKAYARHFALRQSGRNPSKELHSSVNVSRRLDLTQEAHSKEIPIKTSLDSYLRKSSQGNGDLEKKET